MTHSTIRSRVYRWLSIANHFNDQNPIELNASKAEREKEKSSLIADQHVKNRNLRWIECDSLAIHINQQSNWIEKTLFKFACSERNEWTIDCSDGANDRLYRRRCTLFQPARLSSTLCNKIIPTIKTTWKGIARRNLDWLDRKF